MGFMAAMIASGAKEGMGKAASFSEGLTTATLGAGQLALGEIKRRKAEQLRPQEEDPNQVQRLEDAKRKLRQLETGTDATTQANIQEAEQLTAGTQSNLAKITGGNIGGTVDAMLKAQRVGGRNINRAIGEAGQRALGFQGLVERMAQQISQRRLDLQQFRSVQKRAEAAQLRKEGMGNVMGGMATSAGAFKGDSGGGGGTGMDTGNLQTVTQLFGG